VVLELSLAGPDVDEVAVAVEGSGFEDKTFAVAAAVLLQMQAFTDSERRERTLSCRAVMICRAAHLLII
jgi:hypothetical protein